MAPWRRGGGGASLLEEGDLLPVLHAALHLDREGLLLPPKHERLALLARLRKGGRTRPGVRSGGERARAAAAAEAGMPRRRRRRACTGICWYIPGAICFVVMRVLQLHWRVPLPGLSTALSRSTWATPARRAGQRGRRGEAGQEQVPHAAHQWALRRRRARLECSAEVEVPERHLDVHRDGLPLGRLLLLLPAKAAEPAKPTEEPAAR